MPDPDTRVATAKSLESIIFTPSQKICTHVICMQRPDANALKGAIKANILHRFALKLPQNHDSRIILDDGGAETLLGQGDLLYKDANNRVLRLQVQVPFLDNATLKRCLNEVNTRGAGG